MRPFAAFIGITTCLPMTGQSGPAGVGTSASNVLWLSADAGVSTTGMAVTGWNDRSGNGNHATPPSVAARPILTMGALNGKPVLTFDGTDDELRVPDAATLDLNQWDMFMVNADVAPKANNAWYAKGTSTQPNYGLWSTGTDALTMPIFDILGLLSAPSTAAGMTGSAHNVFEYNNTVLLFLFPSRTMYRNGTSIYTDASLLQLPLANNHPLYIGNVQGTAGWNVNGTISEMILYNAPLNSAQRIIVNNYLAAKYGLSLSTNDLYSQDLAANGDYDHEMAGIGRINGANQHTDAQGSSVLRINNPSGLGNNEFMLWGHDNGALGSWGSTDVPSGVDRRWHRVWRVSEVSTAGAAVDVGSVDMSFDLNGQGPVTPTDLRLLVDINNNGVFADDTPVGITATALGGGRYRFAGVTQLVNGRRFTLGTINYQQTPLPVELLFFKAEPEAYGVKLTWATATELESDRFVVLRSADGMAWRELATVQAAGYSTTRIDYALHDPAPIPGMSYYQLHQFDLDGTGRTSDVVTVRFDPQVELVVHPNPASDRVRIDLPGWQGPVLVEVIDGNGRVRVTHTVDGGIAGVAINTAGLPPGTYMIRGRSERMSATARLVIAP